MKNHFWYKKSVAFRLAVKFSIILAFLILCVSGVFIMLLNQSVRDRQKNDLISSASFIMRRFDFKERPSPPSALKGSSSGRPPLRESGSGKGALPPPSIEDEIPYYITFSVFSLEDGNKILFTNDPFLPLLPESNMKVRRYYEKNFFTDGDLNILYYAVDLPVSRFGKVRVLTAMNMDQDRGYRFLFELLPLTLFSFVPLLLLSFAVVYFITRRTMAPVLKIADSANRITIENLDCSLPISGREDEIDNLSKTFNDLFVRLKADFEREKQFTSDVSHELKTPLAVILGHANLIRRWGKEDPVQLQKSLGFLIDEVHSMEAIVENLLQISRLDGGRVKINKQRILLESLCTRLEQDTKAWSPKTQFIIEDSLLNCTVFSDMELFYQACMIIVSNSVKFFIPKENKNLEITLFVLKNGTEISLCIKDNGSGIAGDVLPHIFERFYRGDAAHSRSSGGSGLGLSIVWSIMHTLGGSVRAESDGKSGATLILTLPIEN